MRQYFISHQTTRSKAARGLGAAMLFAVLSLTATAIAGDKNPYLKADDSWITISGTVEAVQPDRFTLDYGDGTITVEMDDGDRDADAYKLVNGDRVVVSGRIDADLFEYTKIEAGTVYVENLGTTFFASSIDEESWGFAESNLAPPVLISRTVVSGIVTDVDADAGEFLINAGTRSIRVDVSEMSIDPLDDEGYLKVEEGDRVRVLGQIDTDLFEGRRLEADTVIELRQG